MTKPQHPLFIYKIREINTFFLVLVKLQFFKHRGNGTVWMEHLGKAKAGIKGQEGRYRGVGRVGN